MSWFSAGEEPVVNECQIKVTWRVSSRSNGTACIEVAKSETAILVRDTKNRDRAILSFPSTAWEDFINAVQTNSITLR
jgi:hypothetical protein